MGHVTWHRHDDDAELNAG